MAARKQSNDNSETETTANDDQENSEETSEKGKKRPRKIYFTCVALKSAAQRDGEGKIVKEDGKPVMETQLAIEEIEVPTVRDRDAALAGFKKLQSVDATNVLGPYYRVRGTATVEKRVSVTVPAKNCTMTGKVWEGVFQGWNVLAHGIKAFKAEQSNGKTAEYVEDEVVLLIFDGLANEAEKAPKPRFGGKPATVLRNALEGAKIQA